MTTRILSLASSVSRRLFWNYSMKMSSTSASISPAPVSGTPDLYSLPVNVQTAAGPGMSVNVVYQDTMPAGSSTGTYFCINGSPGSHKDFKYITPRLSEHNIRVVGINFPGLEFTSIDPRMKHDNFERDQLVQGLVDQLGLDKVVFSGHSRGNENALFCAAKNMDKTKGIVLINPIGLRVHKGIRPVFAVSLFAALWRIQFLRFFSEPILLWVYKMLKFKINSGAQCGVCLQHMSNCAIEQQKPLFDAVCDSKDVKVVLAAAGNDHLVEREIMMELFHACRDLDIHEVDTKGDDVDSTEVMRKAFNEKRNNLGFLFNKEGHFLNKDRAKFIADTVVEILKR